LTLSVIYLDIDNFKWINDNHGHQTGDGVLTEIAATIRSVLRDGDHAARLGGDEFGVLLWNTSSTASGLIAARIVDAVRELGQRFPGSELGASAGYATPTNGTETVEDLLHAADTAMYQVKITGKNSARRSVPPPVA